MREGGENGWRAALAQGVAKHKSELVSWFDGAGLVARIEVHWKRTASSSWIFTPAAAAINGHSNSIDELTDGFSFQRPSGKTVPQPRTGRW